MLELRVQCQRAYHKVPWLTAPSSLLLEVVLLSQWFKKHCFSRLSRDEAHDAPLPIQYLSLPDHRGRGESFHSWDIRSEEMSGPILSSRKECPYDIFKCLLCKVANTYRYMHILLKYRHILTKYWQDTCTYKQIHVHTLKYWHILTNLNTAKIPAHTDRYM